MNYVQRNRKYNLLCLDDLGEKAQQLPPFITTLEEEKGKRTLELG